MAANQNFGAGRAQRIYAPPYTQVVTLDFEDFPFEPTKANHPSSLCGSTNTFQDALIVDNEGGRMFVCSNADICATRKAAGHTGPNQHPVAEPAS